MISITLKTVTLTKPQARDLVRAATIGGVRLRTGKTLEKQGLVYSSPAVDNGIRYYSTTHKGYQYYEAMKEKGIDKKL